MKKNILIGVLVLATVISSVYANFQQVAADKARIEAEKNLVLAVASRREADANAEEALKQAQSAETRVVQLKLAYDQIEKALENCNRKK